MKRASILKFVDNDNYVIYPINTLKGGGGKASSPYYKERDATYEQVAKILIEVLEYSIVDAPRPLDAKATHKHYLKSIGVKTMSELHKGSLSVSVFVKDDKYNISPTTNMGSRKGFQGATKDRITIPISSSIEELAKVLEEAFEKSK